MVSFSNSAETNHRLDAAFSPSHSCLFVCILLVVLRACYGDCLKKSVERTYFIGSLYPDEL